MKNSFKPLIVIYVMQAWQVQGPKCWLYFFPQLTNRNLIKMLGHLILRVLAWPKDVCVEPCMTMEDAIEHWFGTAKTCKRGVHGTATTANAIQAAQLLHLQRCQKQPKEPHILAYHYLKSKFCMTRLVPNFADSTMYTLFERRMWSGTEFTGEVSQWFDMF